MKIRNIIHIAMIVIMKLIIPTIIRRVPFTIIVLLSFLNACL